MTRKPWNLLLTSLIICFVSFTFSSHAELPKIIAHRGASHDAPENTIPAILLAWEKNADAVEVDIHMTADKKIIAIHDKDTLRTTGKKLVVADNKWEDLKDLDAGSWKSEKYKGTKIPLLSEILKHIPSDKQIFVEIKCSSSVIPELVKIIENSKLSPEQINFIAFSYPTITLVKKQFPKNNCYWLSAFMEDPEAGIVYPDAKELIKRAKNANLEGLNVSYRGPLSQDFVKTILNQGLGFYVWTVNDSNMAKKLTRAGVQGITTDRPGFLREKLQYPPALTQ